MFFVQNWDQHCYLEYALFAEICGREYAAVVEFFGELFLELDLFGFWGIYDEAGGDGHRLLKHTFLNIIIYSAKTYLYPNPKK